MGQNSTEVAYGFGQFGSTYLTGDGAKLLLTAATAKYYVCAITMTEDVNIMRQTPGGITDVNMSETETVSPTEAAPMQLTYDQLRARLPREIGDEIVRLLANSYEALADFASIATQADVDNFNVKYGVELVLPQEA